MVVLDIHSYERLYRRTEDLVRNSTLSARNKELIFQYRDACLVHASCGRVRLIRVFSVLLVLSRFTTKNFDDLTKTDVESIVAHVVHHEPRYTAETVSTYKAILRRFLSWVF